MTEVAAVGGLAAAQARVAQLQSMLGAGGPALGRQTGLAGVSRLGSIGVGGRLGAPATSAFDDVLGSVDGTAGLDTDPAEATTGTAAARALRGLTEGATAGSGLGERAVSIARRYLGVPYVWGGTDPDKGLDCSGLTQLVFRQVGVDLDRTSRDQAQQGREVASVADALPGDLVFFGSPVHHVGIYVGDNKILHAPHRGEDVKVSTIWERPSHIRRVLPSSDATPALAGLKGIGGVAQAALAAPASGSGSGSGSVSGPYADLFTRAGRRHGVDPALLSAVAKAESGYRPDAVSRAGARGLMQIMPGTARGLGVDPDVPEQAVDGAARLLSGYLKQYDGRTDLALAAYNAGPGAVRRHGGVPPFSETRTYVQRVTGYWKDLR
ncbi:MAG: transglycosylase SLT domain-containing protein [Kineosporiaceae bacterium]